MKKIYLLVSVVAVAAVSAAAYFSMRPEATQYKDESDVQAYSKRNLLEGLESPKKKKKSLYYSVKHHRPRESTLGFSITPPPGADWYEKLENESLYYLKINKAHKRYSILTEAREVHLRKDLNNLRELKSYVKREKEKSLVSSNFKNPQVAVHIEAFPSEKCVRYSQSYEDHGMKGLREKRYVNVDIQGLFCLHPDNGRVGVDVSYLEKSLSDTDVKSYSNEGEKFLASLTFQKANKK